MPPFGGSLYIADKSAWERAEHPLVAEKWREAILAEQLLTTAPVAHELLYSARNGAEFDEIQEKTSALIEVQLDRSIIAAAMTAMRQLAHIGAKHHRIPFADLLISAAAESRGVGVLHFDRHFDRLTEVFEFESRWIAPAGSL